MENPSVVDSVQQVVQNFARKLQSFTLARNGQR